MENPDAATLRQYGRGAQSFLALGPYPVLASNRDPTMYEFGTRPSSEKEVHVCIHSGGHMVRRPGGLEEAGRRGGTQQPSGERGHGAM